MVYPERVGPACVRVCVCACVRVCVCVCVWVVCDYVCVSLKMQLTRFTSVFLMHVYICIYRYVCIIA